MTAEESFRMLSIGAVAFSALSVLFGIYLVLFILAVWSTYRHPSAAQLRMRWVTVALFFIVCAHYITRSLMFSRARNFDSPAGEETKWTVPLIFVSATTGTLAGLVSDGLVAWRCYVIYGRNKHALYLPATAVILNTMLGLAGDFQQLTVYQSVDLYNDRYATIGLTISSAWGWGTFAINTLLTASIVGRIIYVSRFVSAQCPARDVCICNMRYAVVIEAIVESALVTWIGFLLYEIAAFAPTGHVTNEMNVGYVLVCMTPAYFGISQCLITARLGFAMGHQADTVVPAPIVLSYQSSSDVNKAPFHDRTFRLSATRARGPTISDAESTVNETKRFSLDMAIFSSNDQHITTLA